MRHGPRRQIFFGWPRRLRVALLGDVIRPKTFAGLFAAAPSVALATLTLTIVSNGKPYAAIEARSMVVGALGLYGYVLACQYVPGKRRWQAAPATTRSNSPVGQQD